MKRFPDVGSVSKAQSRRLEPEGLACRGSEWETHPRIFLPETADLGKAGKLRAMGALVATHGRDCVETEAHARSQAEELHGSFISPYNDLQVLQAALTQPTSDKGSCMICSLAQQKPAPTPGCSVHVPRSVSNGQGQTLLLVS